MNYFLSLLMISSVITALPAWGTQSDSLSQCAIDLCGPAESYLPPLARGPFETVIPLGVQQFFSQEADPALLQMTNLTVESLRTQARTLDQLIQNDSSNTLSDQQRALLTVRTLSAKVNPVIMQVIESSDGKTLRVNAEKLQKALPELGADGATKATQVLNSYLASSGFKMSQVVDQLPFDIFLQVFAKSLGMKVSPTLVSVMMGEFKKQATQLEKNLGPFIFANEDTGAFDKAIASQPMTDDEKKRAKSLIQSIFANEAIISSPVIKQAKAMNLSLRDAAKLLNWSSRAEKITAGLSSEESLKVEKNQLLQTCHARLNQAFSAAPSPLRERQALALMEKVKAASLVASRAYLSGDALKAASSAIEKARFEKPADLQQVMANIRENLKSQVARAIKRNQNVQRASAGKDNSKAFIIYSLIQDGGTAEPKFFRGLEKVCESLKPTPFEDKAIPTLGVVQLSWQTALFPELGSGIIAHEIGHIVSAAIQNQLSGTRGYTEARACTANLHREMQKTGGTGSPEQFNEEDWADSFASTVITELKKSWPYSRNYGCALLALDDQKSEFKDLKLSDPSGFDVHSTGLLRAVRLLVSQGGQIPKSCLQNIDSGVEQLLAKSCSR